jgi:hypothetical protein
MWMFSRDQPGYSIVTETTEPAQVRLRLTSQLNRIMREWSAQQPNRYDLDWILSDAAMRLLFWSTRRDRTVETVITAIRTKNGWPPRS